MPFSNIEDRVTFPPTPFPWSAVDQAAVLDAIRTAYDNSNLFQGFVDAWLAPADATIDIFYAPGQFNATAGGGEIVIDPAHHANTLIIDETGTARPYTLLRGVVHELVHALTGTEDEIGLGRAISPGYRGETVELTNLIMEEISIDVASVENYDRNSYIAMDLNGSILEEGFEYTNGAEIDRSVVLDNTFRGLPPVTDWDSSPTGNSADLLIGDFRDNILTSGNGDDFLYGNGGSDTLNGGRGQDFLSGGTNSSSEDRLFGEAGNDILVGGAGEDILDGGAGRDLLIASEFADRFTDTSIDFLTGGNGDDVLVGGSGGAVLRGGQGNDLMIGGSSDDLFEGGISADYIYTGGGADEIRGGAGNDWINATAPGSAATVYVSADSGRDYIQQAADGSGITGVESIVFEGLSGQDVELVFEVLTSDIYEELNTDRDGDPQLLREGEFTATAYIRVESTGASINIGEITISLFEFYLGDTDASLLLERSVRVRMENEHRLVFEDGEIDPTNGSLIRNNYEWRRRFDPETGTYLPEPINDDATVLAWDDAVEASINRYDNAPNNFANGFSNPFVRDDVNLLDPVTDYGLIGTTDAFGLLI